MDLSGLKKHAIVEVTHNILPYWLNQAWDSTYGGYIGRIDGKGLKHPTAPKGLVLNARILWTFAAALRVYQGDEAYATAAQRAYEYLETYFWDPVHGGGFWMLDYLGKPLDTKKLTYAQAFWLYGLSEFAIVTKDKSALKKAEQLFALMEKRTKDLLHGGYYEGFDRSWMLDETERLSDKDAIAPKSSNTMLHVLEAYTAFLRASNRDDVKSALRETLLIFLDHIVDPETHQMHLAFDRHWTPVTEEVSFGHDIEASWLLIEAAKLLDEAAIYTRTVDEALAMVDVVLKEGLAEDGSVLYSRNNGAMDRDRHWWTQAEGVVGFLNAYQITGASKYAEAATKLWEYIEASIIDREQGGWLYRLSDTGHTYPEDNKVGPWKCPYHNARACLEVIARIPD